MKNGWNTLLNEVLGHDTVNRWILVGAYGRTYKVVEDAIKDFMDGKDFMIYQGPYCSIRDWNGEEVYVFCDGKFIKLTLGYDKYKLR